MKATDHDEQPVQAESIPGAEHLAFACTGCGDCCRRHRVAVTHTDLARLRRVVAEPLESLIEWLAPEGVDPDAEASCFVTLPNGPRLMVLAHGQSGCRLLTPDDRCSVYSARPRDCELYPFVVERNERKRPLRLSLFEAEPCGKTSELRASLEALTRADAERWSEVESYRALVSRWNRLAEHRRRFGHRTRGPGEFLTFLESVAQDA